MEAAPLRVGSAGSVGRRCPDGGRRHQGDSREMEVDGSALVEVRVSGGSGRENGDPAPASGVDGEELCKEKRGKKCQRLDGVFRDQSGSVKSD